MWVPDGAKILKSTEYTNATDRRTDRQTDTARRHRSRLFIASRGKNWNTSNSLSALENTRSPRSQLSLLLLLLRLLLLATMMRVGVTWWLVVTWQGGRQIRRHLSTTKTERSARMNTAQLHVARPAQRSNAAWIYSQYIVPVIDPSSHRVQTFTINNVLFRSQC